MAKHSCAICGAEVGLMTAHKLADGNHICRKVCGKKCLALFDKIPATLQDVTDHIAQVEFGTKAWNQIFVPLKKTKDKNAKLKQLGVGSHLLYVSPSTGLIALTENRYKFMMFGKTTIACVYRLADLYEYVYEQESKQDSDGKKTNEDYAHLYFRNVSGLYEFKLNMASKKDFDKLEEYFNNMFGIQKTLRNSINNAKKQINAIKSVAGAVKAAANGEEGMEAQAAEAAAAVEEYAHGDRTQWIKMADAALAQVR